MSLNSSFFLFGLDILVVLFLVLHALQSPYSVLYILKDLTVSRDSITQKTDKEAYNTDEHQDGHEEEELYVSAVMTELGNYEVVDTDTETDKEQYDTDCREKLHRLIHDERAGDNGRRTLHVFPHAREKSRRSCLAY